MATASEAYAKQANKYKWKQRLGWVVETLKILAIIALVVMMTCLVGAGVAYGLAKPTCNSETANIGFPHQWSFWGGCQIEVTEGKWIPLSNYYYTEHP